MIAYLVGGGVGVAGIVVSLWALLSREKARRQVTYLDGQLKLAIRDRREATLAATELGAQLDASEKQRHETVFKLQSLIKEKDARATACRDEIQATILGASTLVEAASLARAHLDRSLSVPGSPAPGDADGGGDAPRAVPPESTTVTALRRGDG